MDLRRLLTGLLSFVLLCGTLMGITPAGAIDVFAVEVSTTADRAVTTPLTGQTLSGDVFIHVTPS